MGLRGLRLPVYAAKKSSYADSDVRLYIDGQVIVNEGDRPRIHLNTKNFVDPYLFSRAFMANLSESPSTGTVVNVTPLNP